MGGDVYWEPSFWPALLGTIVGAAVGYWISDTAIGVGTGMFLGLMLATFAQWADMTTKRLMRIEQKLNRMVQD